MEPLVPGRRPDVAPGVRLKHVQHTCGEQLMPAHHTHIAGPDIAEFSPISQAQSRVAPSTAWMAPPSTALFCSMDAPVHEVVPSPILYKNPPLSPALLVKFPPVIYIIVRQETGVVLERNRYLTRGTAMLIDIVMAQGEKRV